MVYSLYFPIDSFWRVEDDTQIMKHHITIHTIYRLVWDRNLIDLVTLRDFTMLSMNKACRWLTNPPDVETVCGSGSFFSDFFPMGSVHSMLLQERVSSLWITLTATHIVNPYFDWCPTKALSLTLPAACAVQVSIQHWQHDGFITSTREMYLLFVFLSKLCSARLWHIL